MFLLQNVYTSKESTSYIVSSKLLQTLEAAIKERDDAVEDAVVNHYGDYNEDSIDIQEGANSKCICGPDFMDANNYSIGSIPFMFMSCIFFPAFAIHCIHNSPKSSCYLLQSQYTEVIEKIKATNKIQNRYTAIS